jgi:signal transduction histidine kinase
MKTSLFGRNFLIYALVIALSFSALGLTFVIRVDSFTNQETRNQLQESAQRALNSAHSYALFQASVDQAFDGLRPQFSRSMQLNLCQLADDCGGVIFVSDTAGRIQFIATAEGCVSMERQSYFPATGGGSHLPLPESQSNIPRTVPGDTVTSLLGSGSYSATTDFGGIFEEKHFLIGLSTVQPGRTGGETDVLVYVAAPADHSLSFFREIRQVFMTHVMMVLFLTLLATFIATRQTVKPIRQLSWVSRAFARGEFGARVPLPKSRDELYDMAVSFNNMADSVQSMEESRRSLMASVSHDLRTPMTTISGFADAMLDGTIPPDKQQEYLQIISSETKRLSRMASSMLQVSRLESGAPLNKTAFDLSEMIRRVVISFERKLEEKQLEILLDIPESQQITADHDALFQVVYNLFDNAVKFTPDKGTVTIYMHVSGGTVQFNILNTGSPIPAEQLRHVFDRFYKGDASRGINKNGSGLGLYIVKTIVNRHGGDIWANSGEDRTEFCFTMPANG